MTSTTSTKSSRWLKKIEAQMAQALSGPSWQIDCWRAERAAYLGRLGHFAEAQTELNALRLAHPLKPSSQLSIWLNLAEGVLLFYKDMGSASAVKLRRAHALSVATGWGPLQALSATWLAHWALLELDVAPLARYLEEAFTAASHDDHRARSRCCLVMAQAWDTSGQQAFAQAWYELAHAHAVQEGDDTLMSAIIHNKAWLGASHWRQAFWTQNPLEGSKQAAKAWMAADSVQNFDRLVGTISLSALCEVLRAQLLALRGQAQEALSLYEQHLAAAIAQGMQRHHASLLADQAWCRLQVGQTEAALQDAQVAQALIQPQSDHQDDCACAHSRLAQIWQALGHPADAHRHTTLAKTAWAGHISFQSHLAQALGKITAKLEAT
jgi:tetratricopeptide (TPR) repeat protein